MDTANLVTHINTNTTTDIPTLPQVNSTLGQVMDIPTDGANEQEPMEPVKKPRKKAKPSTTTRSLDELSSVDPKKMTPAECIRHIHDCRETIAKMTCRLSELSKTCSKAFEQFRNADEAYKRLKTDADTRLRFCEQAVAVCHESIRMQGGSR